MRRLFLLISAVALLWAADTSAQINPAGLKVSGPADRAAVLKVIMSHASQVRACIAARHKSVPSLAGKLAIQLQINTSGKVSSATQVAKLSTVHDSGLAACLTARIKTWRFAKPESTATVTKVFIISSSKADKERGDRKRGKAKLEDAPADSLGYGGGGVGSVGSRSGGTSGRRATTRRPPPRTTAPKSAPSARPTKPRRSYDEAPVEEAVREGRSSSRRSAPRAVAAPAMKAGRHDDNKQYNRFLKFLKDNRHLVDYTLKINERLVVRALDQNEKSLHNCTVKVLEGDKTLSNGISYADGSTHFFPSDKGSKGAKSFTVKASCQGKDRTVEVPRDGVRTTDIKFDFARTVPKRVPLDIAIVLDTTGSMQSQIDRLKKTLQAIHLQLTQLKTKPDIRFALVAYRDQGDDYVTQVTKFTANVDKFQRQLNKLEADGGGDTPEDLQAALRDALEKLDWRHDAVRLGFVVADAIPHTDYGQKFTYRTAMRESLRRGIKWGTVGAGGLPRKGEVIFRQIAQFTMGEYVFVTQGSRGNSDGGVGEASHHVGTNYRVENLDQAILRIIRRELSYLTDEPSDFDYTIVASGTKATPRDKVLAPAVQEAVRQLTDYCSIRLDAKTPVAILPVESKDKTYKDVAEYLTEQMILTASRKPDFKVVERDMRAIAQEMKLQFSDMFDVEQTVKFGKLSGAELLIVARLTVRGEDAELYGKLVRVETGEILSAAKVHFKGGVVKGS